MSDNEFNGKDISREAEVNQPTDEAVSSEDLPKRKIEYDESLFENSTIFGESTVTVKKRRLTPLAKGLISSAAAVVLAAAILVITVYIPNAAGNGDTSSIAAAPSYTVTSIAEAKVKRLTVYNNNHPDGYSAYKVYNSLSDSQSSSSGSVSYTWQIEGYEKYDLSRVKYLVQSVLAISSSKRYDNLESPKADDYEIGDLDFTSSASESSESEDSGNVYGFDKPYAAVNVEAETGATKIIIGDRAPDYSGRYVTVSGDDSVYVVSESDLSYVDENFKDLINLDTVEYIVQNSTNKDYFTDGTLTKIDSIKLGGSCRSTSIVIESPPDDLSAISFISTLPVFRACDEDTVNSILAIATSGLLNEGAYVLGYTAADLEKYGLSNPYSTVEINIGSYKASMKFGAPIDSYYPCIVEGRDVIYRIAMGDGSEENPDWISYKDTDIYYDSLYLEYITGISSIKMEFADKQATFNLKHIENEDGSKSFTVDCAEANDGVTIPKKQLSYLYGRLLNINAESTTEDPVPDTEPYLTITVSYTDKSRSADVIRMYKATTRRYFYTINGSGNALVSANRVEDLYARMNDLLAGIEIKQGN